MHLFKAHQKTKPGMGNGSSTAVDSTDGQRSSQAPTQEEDDADNVSLPQEFSDKYRFISSIGRGGFGNVYKVRDIRTKAVYAVKVLSLNDSNQNEVTVLFNTLSPVHTTLLVCESSYIPYT